MFTKHVLIAKSVVTLLIGALFGYAIAGNVARDAARGRALTKDAYVADFERFKAKLETSEVPTPVAIVSGVVMALGAFGIYELLALGLAKAIGAVAVRLGEESRWRRPDSADRQLLVTPARRRVRDRASSNG